jgi:terminase, large subunit
MDMSEIHKAVRKGLKSLEVATPMRLSEWAAENFYLSAESSYVEKKWEPFWFQPAIMDAISDDEIEEVNVKKSARVGYTKIILAAIGYTAHHKRRNQAVWQPTDDDRDEFVQTEVEPMLRDVAIMTTVFRGAKVNAKGNSLKQKRFVGSMCHMRGGKAAKNYRRISVDTAYLDEIDGFDHDVEGEGSPVKLAYKRVEGATFPKLVIGSTPKTKGTSLIENRVDQAQLRFRPHVPCMHCGERILIQWGGKDKPYGFKWYNNDPETVGHVCQYCAGVMTQADYIAAGPQGRWIAADGTWIDSDFLFRDAAGNVVPKPAHVAFDCLWTAYSEMTSWAKIVREWLAAVAKNEAGDSADLKAFINTTLGESYEETGEKADEHALLARAKDYPLRVVPMGGLILVAGVDVQDDRFEIVIWALGRKEEMWPIDYTVIDANPADPSDWDKLDAHLQIVFPHAAGGQMAVRGAAVDTGGHFTHEAYNFCRVRTARRIYAVRGEPREGQPIKGRSSKVDVNARGKVLKGGVKLWHVGTDTAKDLLLGRLSVEQAGPGYVHFSKELPNEFFHQLTAEQRIKVKTSQGEKYRWVKVRTRNEVLDCTVYALFVAQMLDLHRYTDKQWDLLESKVRPMTLDMFGTPLPPAAPTLPASQPGQTTAPANPAEMRIQADPSSAKVIGGRISLSGLRKVTT